MKVFAKKVFKGDGPSIVKWDQPTVRKFDGKTVYGRPTKGYGISKFNYAGKLYNPEPWTLPMEDIKDKAEEWASKLMDKPIEFTFCLCGLYETGDDYIPHHSDTVPTLDDVVLGISFGGTRVLEWNQYSTTVKKDTNTSELWGALLAKPSLQTEQRYIPETTRFLLEEGDVYLFDGHSQMTATHSVPSLVGCKRRVSLTFRSGL
tara:strand:+ start:2448 stop:3059 length:612 start_codon:yes stop_codon:yes gene_type:complete